MSFILLAVINATINTLVKQREKLVNDFLVIGSSIKKRANTFIARHFTLPGHSVKDIRTHPIEHITPRPGDTEKDVTIRRLDRERFWMLELAILYPYGLNDRLQHVGNVSHSNVRSGINVLNLFNRHKRRKRSHGHRRNSQVGYSGINVTGGSDVFFLGLKFSTPAFFWVEDLTVYFFGSEKSARIFLGSNFRQANSSYAIQAKVPARSERV